MTESKPEKQKTRSTEKQLDLPDEVYKYAKRMEDLAKRFTHLPGDLLNDHNNLVGKAWATFVKEKGLDGASKQELARAM